MILSVVIENLGGVLNEMVKDEACRVWNVSSDIEELESRRRRIQAVVEDAERRQTSSEAIARWVEELKDVLYDAQDASDDFQLRKMKNKKHRVDSSTCFLSRIVHDGKSYISNLFTSDEIASKIKELNCRINKIVSDIDLLGLVGVREKVDQGRVMGSKTWPGVILCDLVGEKIGNDAEELIELLTRKATVGIQVVSIEGIGGIGKTTLAKKIYSDRRIEEEFSLRIWICVSKERRSLEAIVQQVIREVGGDCGGAEEISELKPMLQRYVAGQKFFLVLDDVWDAQVWEGLLREAMIHGAPGSRVLITTRDGCVARRMDAVHQHKVHRLSNHDGLALLMKQVFPNGSSESEVEHLNDIGMQLVEKCNGLPLAIKSIAGMLRNKRKSVGEWQTVLRNHVRSTSGLPEDVHKAFYLSYMDLRPPLRECFICCSLFPEDFKFHKPNLIHLWLAEGYLGETGNLWDLGTEYYNELLSRNFLEDTGVYYDQNECKMHDMLRYFARCLRKYENCILREEKQLSKSMGSPKVRRLSVEGNTVKNIDIIMKEKSLRTLLLSNKQEIPLDDICKGLSFLRILDLSESNISSLPDSLSNLNLLRYLHVGGTKISTLPESIGYLSNLLYLNCARCVELVEVPSSISYLRELEFLSFNKTKVKGIPTSLKNLEKLVYLFGYKPDKNSLDGFSTLDELEHLSKLVILKLEDLENVTDTAAEKACLRTKDKMRELYLCYSLSWQLQLSQTNDEKIRIKDTLNELCPPPDLEVLRIEGYSGSTLPKWLNLDAAFPFPNLRSLEITNCACIEELAPLGELSDLDFLRLSEVRSVVIVGQELFWRRTEREDMTSRSRSATAAFPKLSQLEFEGMPKWKEWQWSKEEPAMPKLQKLFILNCPELRSLPEGLSNHATSLEHLEIKGAEKLSTIESLQSLTDLCVVQNPKLERVSDLPKISRVLIKNCSNLKTLTPNISRWMELVDYQMLFLPDYLRTTVPNKLTIRCHKDLWNKIKSQEETGGSEWLKFMHMSCVNICTEGQTPPIYYPRTHSTSQTTSTPGHYVNARVEA